MDSTKQKKMNNTDILSYIKEQIPKTLMGHPFEPIDAKTISTITDEICSIIDHANGQDYKVYYNEPCALWGMIDGNLADPGNPKAKPIIICRNGFYDIEEDRFIADETGRELTPNIRKMLENSSIKVAPKIDETRMEFTVEFKPAPILIFRISR